MPIERQKRDVSFQSSQFSVALPLRAFAGNSRGRLGCSSGSFRRNNPTRFFNRPILTRQDFSRRSENRDTKALRFCELVHEKIPRLTYIEKRIPFSKMRFVPGDGSKQSLKARGLNFEMIIEAIATNGIVSAYHRSKYPSQVVLIVNINGYMHCVPCERRGEEMRLITAWPSRKYQKKYL